MPPRDPPADNDFQQFVEASNRVETWLMDAGVYLGRSARDGVSPPLRDAAELIDVLVSLNEKLSEIESLIHLWAGRIISCDPSGSTASAKVLGCFAATGHQCAMTLLFNLRSSFNRFLERQQLPEDPNDWDEHHFAAFWKWAEDEGDYHEELTALAMRIERELAYVTSIYGEPDGYYSRPRAPKEWLRILATLGDEISLSTFNRRCETGIYKAIKITTKRVRIHSSTLPDAYSDRIK